MTFEDQIRALLDEAQFTSELGLRGLMEETLVPSDQTDDERWEYADKTFQALCDGLLAVARGMDAVVARLGQLPD